MQSKPKDHPARNESIRHKPLCDFKKFTGFLIWELIAAVFISTSIPAGVLCQGVVADVDPHRISLLVRSSKLDDRANGVGLASLLEPSQITEELRTSLLALFRTENKRSLENESGKVFFDNDEKETEMMTSLHRIVVKFHDPHLIPDMVDGLGMFTLIRPLADFGVQSVRPILKMVTSPQSPYNPVNDGLRALRVIVEENGLSKLAPDDLKSIRAVARKRLTEKQTSFTTVWYMIDLALLLDDAQLRQIVEKIATDKSAVSNLGVNDSDLITKTQQRAKDRLAGIPATPPPSGFRN